MEKMYTISTQAMYDDLSTNQLTLKLADYLRGVNYSDKYIINAIGAHLEIVTPDISLFKKFRHLFTDNDIQLEINLSDQEKVTIQY